jgi:hypothetical protein
VSLLEARAAWPRIVGAELADASEPVALVAGDVVTIRTTAAGANVLAFMEADIVRGLAPIAAVKRLRFRVAQQAAASC